MDIPLAVLKGLNFFTPKEDSQIPSVSTDNTNTSQFNEPEPYCPVGCDPSRTKLAISKSGRKDKGNFVNVYYRGSSKLKTEVPFEVKQESFWRELYELSERSKQSRSNRPQSDRRTN